MSAPPEWATETIAVICRREGRELPTITWQRSRVVGKSTSGYHQGGRIFIRAGTMGRDDQRMVLLHELAHYLTGEGHTPSFYDVYVDLLLRGILFGFALKHSPEPTRKLVAALRRRQHAEEQAGGLARNGARAGRGRRGIVHG